MNINNLLAKGYRLLWSPTTQRPWTYAIRQTAGWKVSLAIAIAFAILLVLVSINPYAAVIAALASGFLAGHLWWDTKGTYIKHKEYFKENDDVKW